MQRTKWTDRKFTFDYPEGWMPNILERLRGTAPRIREMVKETSNSILSDNILGWTVKEHVGHLTDLEELHEGRIDDLLERKEKLRPADMANEKTNEAAHNQQDIEYLIWLFEKSRNRLVSRLQNLDEATQAYKALHPRLQAMMRAVDIAYFTAEHDDHHLASIRAILDKIAE